MKSLLILGLISFCTAAYADDVSMLRERLIESILPRDPAARQQIVAEANRMSAKLKADATWDDIDYAQKDRTFWSPEKHMDRVLLISRAYAIDHNLQRLDQIHRALDYWFEHDYQNPNWWHNQIGIPQLVGQSMLMMEPNVTPAQTSKAIEILKRAVWDKWTGQNLVWGVSIQIFRGLIQNDPDLITQGFDRMYQEVRVTQSEGIQPDQSFHQHGDQFYSGGYGLSFAVDLPRYISISLGTRWQIPDEQLAIFQSYLLDGEQWMMHNARFDYSAIGRQITRPGMSAVPRSWTSGPCA
jgi:chondroitin AC lyase